MEWSITISVKNISLSDVTIWCNWSHCFCFSSSFHLIQNIVGHYCYFLLYTLFSKSDTFLSWSFLIFLYRLWTFIFAPLSSFMNGVTRVLLLLFSKISSVPIKCCLLCIFVAFKSIIITLYKLYLHVCCSIRWVGKYEFKICQIITFAWPRGV